MTFLTYHPAVVFLVCCRLVARRLTGTLLANGSASTKLRDDFNLILTATLTLLAC